MSLFDIERIKKHLLPQNKIRFFRDIPDRTISPEVIVRLSACASFWDGYDHPDYGDTYGDFKRNKNRCNFENMYINRRQHLADIAFYEIFTGDGKYLPKIEELIRLICSEDTWCVPAHAHIKPAGYEGHVIELYASETASVLSFICYFLKDKISPSITSEIKRAVFERMFTPYTISDGYGWMGVDGRSVNNWNPWINSNIIFCAALIADEELYKQLVLRACTLTENYIRSIPSDCLCDEGVRYWNLSGACLFDIVELMYDLTGGSFDITASYEVASACSYPIAMYDEHGLPANFADATIEFYPDCALLTRAGERTKNQTLYNLGRYLYRVEGIRSLHDNFYRQLKNVYTASTITKPTELNLPACSFLKGINVVTMRKNGFFLSFKSNHNGESHNHNDVGSFVLYRNGTPLFVDAGVDHYSGYTFGKERFNLWYLRSEYHNLPVINGNAQKPGKAFKGTDISYSGMSASSDISGAYGLENEGSWVRSANLEGETVIINDSFTFDTDGTFLHYILMERPVIDSNTLRFSNGTVASFENAEIIGIEALDLTGTNPPDGIVGDAANRKTNVPSILIPRIFERQWGQTELYRVKVVPTEKNVTLTVS